MGDSSWPRTCLSASPSVRTKPGVEVRSDLKSLNSSRGELLG